MTSTSEQYYCEFEPNPVEYAEDEYDPTEHAEDGCDPIESAEEDEIDPSEYAEDGGDPVEPTEPGFHHPCDDVGAPAQLENSRGSDATGTKRKKKNKKGPKLPIQAFFASYAPLFQYNPTASSSLEFYRLCDQFGWHRRHPERQSVRQKFDDALVLQFNKIYGTKIQSYKSWKKLCRVTRIKPFPGNIQACREAMQGKFVNLVDLVDANNSPMKVGLFETERQLSEYTLSTGKFFPGENAHAGKLLRLLHLRRQIVHPRNDGPSHSHPRKGTKGRR
ncbi:hypothetical protein JVU11DRAFT_11863 [Chiua virens]|nr:hypothetical protein JVU11DRAFT_11863 [Chiua virens]